MKLWMKKIHNAILVLLLFAVAFSVLLCSCDPSSVSRTSALPVSGSDIGRDMAGYLVLDIPVSLKNFPGGEGTKSISIEYEKPVFSLEYSAIPLFGSEDPREVPGCVQTPVPLESGVLRLACGPWRIALFAKDASGNVLYSAQKDVEVSPEVARKGIEMVLAARDPVGTGILRLSFEEMNASSGTTLSLVSKNVLTGDESLYDISAAMKEPFALEMPAGTYILTVLKRYEESDGLSYERERSIGHTVLARVEAGREVSIKGDLCDFRERGEVFLTLPTVLEDAMYPAYDYFTYEELKAYGYHGNIFISEYLDGLKMEDALYLTPERDIEAPGESTQVSDAAHSSASDRPVPIERLGKAAGQRLYAHRKSYTLDWNLSSETEWSASGVCEIDDEESTKPGVYYWNTSIKVPLVRRKGYELTGWTPSYTGYMPPEDASYKPIWTPETFTLFLDYNLPEISDAYLACDTDAIARLSGNVRITYGMPYEGLPVPVLTEYEFLGWELKNGEGRILSESSVVDAEGDAEARALWKKKSLTVSYNLNLPADYSGSQPNAAGGRTIAYGEAFTHPFDSFDADNYVFSGWYTAREGGDPVLSGTVATPGRSGETLVLYAHWERKAKIRIRVKNIDSLAFDTKYPVHLYGVNKVMPHEITDDGAYKTLEFYGARGMRYQVSWTWSRTEKYSCSGVGAYLLSVSDMTKECTVRYAITIDGEDKVYTSESPVYLRDYKIEFSEIPLDGKKNTQMVCTNDYYKDFPGGSVWCYIKLKNAYTYVANVTNRFDNIKDDVRFVFKYGRYSGDMGNYYPTGSFCCECSDGKTAQVDGPHLWMTNSFTFKGFYSSYY